MKLEIRNEYEMSNNNFFLDWNLGEKFKKKATTWNLQLGTCWFICGFTMIYGFFGNIINLMAKHVEVSFEIN